VSIANGKFPSWTLFIQVMTFEQAEKHKFNPFDLTKVWPHSEYPLIPVGKLTLDRNPKKYFSEVEQLAFSPSAMPPGIEPSPDKMLQGRLFAYDDTHRHRLGANFLQIPVNCPYRTRVNNYQRDGPQAYAEQPTGPNYYPNSFGGPQDSQAYNESRFKVTADVARYNSADEDNFTQPNNFWTKVLGPEERKHTAANVAGHLVNAQEFLQERAVKMFSQINPEYGQLIQENLKKLKEKRSANSRL